MSNAPKVFMSYTRLELVHVSCPARLLGPSASSSAWTTRCIGRLRPPANSAVRFLQ